MKCETVRCYIDRYCAASLPEELMQTMDDHLANCMSCAEALMLDADPFLEDLLRQPWYAETPSPDFTLLVMKQVNAPRSLHRYWWLLAVWFGYAAMWGSLGLWLLLHTRAGYFLQPLLDALRTLSVAMRAVGGALSVFHINQFGVLLVFSLVAIVFGGIGLLSKEGLQ